MKTRSLFKGWKGYLWITLGSLITATAMNLFLVPYKIAPGGVTGIATVIYYISGSRLPVGAIMLALNVPLLMLGLKYLGGRFGIRTIFGTLFLSFVIDISEPFTRNFVEGYRIKLEEAASYPDILLYSIFGGLLMGIGLGLVFRSGATTGGTDLAARLINHWIPALTIGQTLLLIDSAVVVFAAVTFKSFQLALYAIVTLFITSKVIDAVLEGVNFAKALFIISDKAEEISMKIMEDLDRGVTALKGTGMYTGDEKQVLFCVVHRAQLPRLKEIVREIDARAFVVLAEIREVLGEGFKTYE
jgi:uncharacterized membrane-anchored protein YitT (DUF2179 family)